MVGSERLAGLLRRLLLLCCLAGSVATADSLRAGAVDVGGVHFAERARIGEGEALLNGAGLRRILGIHLYVIGLYLPHPVGSAEEALALRGAKRIEIVLRADLSADMLLAVITRGLHKNLNDTEFFALQEPIDMLGAAVRATAYAAKGSLIQLDWLPAENSGKGATRLYVNGQRRGEDIPDEVFFRALLKVWLGARVNDAELRSALLGQGGAH